LGMRSMGVWLLILVSLFLFYLTYMFLDYYMVTFFPSLMPATVTEGIAALNFLISIWENVLVWAVTLCVLIYGIISQDETPEGAVMYAG